MPPTATVMGPECHCHLLGPNKTQRLNWANPTMTLRHTSEPSVQPHCSLHQPPGDRFCWFSSQEGVPKQTINTSGQVGLGFPSISMFLHFREVEEHFLAINRGKFFKYRGNTRNAALREGPCLRQIVRDGRHS